MTAAGWLLWFAICWGVFLVYCAVNLPALCARVAHLLANLRPGSTR